MFDSLYSIEFWKFEVVTTMNRPLIHILFIRHKARGERRILMRVLYVHFVWEFTVEWEQ